MVTLVGVAVMQTGASQGGLAVKDQGGTIISLPGNAVQNFACDSANGRAISTLSKGNYAANTAFGFSVWGSATANSFLLYCSLEVNFYRGTV